MNNPYSVLGISTNATDEEVKAAYKELARKYHPDNYANNPLADLAAEKMKEINAAYDAIVTQRQQAAQQQSYQQSNYQQNNAQSQYSDVRRLLGQGRIVEAEEILNGVPTDRRNAEWHFLKGHVLYARGWLDEAVKHYQTAARMEPGNAEYQAATQQFQSGQRGYTYTGQNYTCDPCTTLLCLNCLCNGRLCC